MLVSCDWWFSIRIFFFGAKKPSPMTPTCTVVNFHNLHSLLGRLIFEQTESRDWSWFVGKKYPKGIQRELKISCRRKSQLVVSYQVVTDPCCGLSVIFCGFISHLIGRETINIPEIFSSVHGFVGTTVKAFQIRLFFNTSIFHFIGTLITNLRGDPEFYRRPARALERSRVR